MELALALNGRRFVRARDLDSNRGSTREGPFHQDRAPVGSGDGGVEVLEDEVRMGEERGVPEDEGVSLGCPGQDVPAVGVRPHDLAEVKLFPRVGDAVHEGVAQEGDADRRAVLYDSFARGIRRLVWRDGRGRWQNGQRQDEGGNGQNCFHHRRKSERQKGENGLALGFPFTEMLYICSNIE